MDTDRLLEWIAKRGLSNSEFAEAIGIDSSTFYRKLQSKGLKFTVGQMHATVKVLNLSPREARAIFMPSNSH